MKKRTYYTLAVLEDGVWHPDFGDYSLRVVKQELKDGYDTESGLPVRIFASGDSQAEIDECLRRASVNSTKELKTAERHMAESLARLSEVLKS